MPQNAISTPEQGQFVSLRQRFWLVQDVIESHTDDSYHHRVLLECLDDDNIGHMLSVIWQHEIDPQIYRQTGLPSPAQHWDGAAIFEAFTRAIDWSSASMLEQQSIQAPFYSAVRIHEYQLEPVARALTFPRVNLLIADDVGLGKTIEAGFVIQELLARRRIRRMLIVCPASLQQQWKEEMRDKFRLDFSIIDRGQIQQLRREYGVHVNPWMSFPRLITSMDFLKREQPLRLFRESLQHEAGAPLRDWDLLIVDEAHNVAPSGRGRYAVDSDRTRMIRRINKHFEHRLFLTATPHNGYTESFTALLELLDPLRFSRGPEVNQQQLQQIMIRRLKKEVRRSLGNREFAEREVKSLSMSLTPAENELFTLLDRYTQSRLASADSKKSLPLRFALTMLKKRLLSSPRAFMQSISTHLNTLNAPDDIQPDEVLLEQMTERVNEDWADDDEKALAEEDALTESSRFFTDLTDDERQMLQTIADRTGEDNDSKLTYLINWINNHLHTDSEWNDERLVIFTEYRDTLSYLHDNLVDVYGDDRVLTLFGGMRTGDREQIKYNFQANPDNSPVRILVATDAASEGLNLQRHCRYLIHYEIPWNPNRMEQRNGRIDRHGQTADVVYVHHFLYANREDSRFLQTVIDKVQNMQADLGSVGDVIAAQVEEAMLGNQPELTLPQQRQQQVQDVVKADLITEQRIREIRRQIDRTRDELQLTPDKMALVLDSALRVLNQQPGLADATDPALTGQAYRLRNLPDEWQSLTVTLKNEHGEWMDITFDNDTAEQHDNLVLLHLNHPLMRRALGTFRARLWSDESDSRSLSRVSYRVSPDYSVPVVLAYGRLVATGASSQRLHEELICVGGEIEEQTLFSLPQSDIERLLNKSYTHPPVSKDTADRLRRLFLHHEKQLTTWLDDARDNQQGRLQQLAADQAETHASAMQELIDDRINELRQRVKTFHEKQGIYQLNLFDSDEKKQYEEDRDWLKNRLTEMIDERETRPQEVRDSYQLEDVRVFPMAVLYLLPDRLVQQES